jgi:preprotein translocase subunit SecB
MATTNGGTNGGAANGGQPAAPPEGASHFGVLTQYIKDLSFENPNAPQSLAPQQVQPQISIQINVTPKQLNNTDFEIELKIEGKAEVGTTLLFGFDLVYAGVFRLQNVPQESAGPLVMIECPRLLFPFAREIIARCVVSGGFPPLMIDPVDFVALYQQKMAEFNATQPPATA